MRNTILFALFMGIACLLHAQTAITGKVVDSKDGGPLAGASVKVKSTKAGTSTNNDGTFKVSARPDDILEISLIGYSTQSFPLHGLTAVTVALVLASSELS